MFRRDRHLQAPYTNVAKTYSNKLAMQQSRISNV